MQLQICDMQANRTIGESRSSNWMHDVIALLDAAVVQLSWENAAHGTIREATSLLRSQIVRHPAEHRTHGNERLLAWQERKVLDFVDSQIAGRVLVANLSALVGRSKAHFSRCFRGTFGCSPRVFVIRRRVELAARSMLQTDKSLTELALDVDFPIRHI